MWEIYQNLPSYIDPIAVSFGPISVFWYSLMWIIAFVTGYALLVYRTKKREGDYTMVFLQDIVTNGLIGALIGGRLGYVIFYDLAYYVQNPLQIISPYDFSTGVWTGIYGMSYHGGLIGMILALAWTARKDQKDILSLLDYIAPIAPIGYMFGRIGNFLNAELVGRVTTSPFGMYFHDEIVARHPSQLYEAFLEGVVLFIALWHLRNRHLRKGALTALYLIGYALARFCVEYFRQPDAHLGFIFANITMGQLLSSAMFFVGVGMLIVLYKSDITVFFTEKRKL
jgi:phosphatidylglycerol:prolipoprotein diacylglycerol transferase